ncbi:hypothetical protein VQ02_09510 [Methylobacterium variabile]|jgi:hypothetical protein|uniref:DUF2059 domain-containing protein n=1 Tax=Methylobacterium variabile TaxID=298794 RepID=A0A0J6T2E3_9HYPH|nr:hypothetical protein [Methylobacterium variabile]KMO39758.1 hypothetical protein VQ02_09510 [Methylobacterium variabile]
MRRALSLLVAGLALGLSLAGAAFAQDERVALARDIVAKTVARNLTSAFAQAEEKTLASMSAEQAAKLRPELEKSFGQERDTLVDQLSKEYAQKFDTGELKRLAAIYDDPTYQKFQALNADPTSMVTSITKDAVTKMMNLLTLAVLSQQGNGQTPAPQGAPAPAPVPAPAKP